MPWSKGGWLISDSVLEQFFQRAQSSMGLEFTWSKYVLSEVGPNVARTVSKKFEACYADPSVAKVAGLYTFWIAKLKPAFGVKVPRFLNEVLALSIGFAVVRERLDVSISISREELLQICETLRYHTSSPHTMMHIYEGWIKRSADGAKT